MITSSPKTARLVAEMRSKKTVGDLIVGFCFVALVLTALANLTTDNALTKWWGKVVSPSITSIFKR